MRHLWLRLGPLWLRTRASWRVRLELALAFCILLLLWPLLPFSHRSLAHPSALLFLPLGLWFDLWFDLLAHPRSLARPSLLAAAASCAACWGTALLLHLLATT